MMSSMMRYSVLAILFGLVGILASLAFAMRGEGHEDGAHDVALPGTQSRIMQIATISRTPAIDRAFAEFSAAGYFGAFAATPDGIFAWSAQLHTAADARDRALDRCNAKRRPGGIPCRLVAEIQPAGDAAGGRITLSQHGTAEFMTYLAGEGHAAFAMSRNGAVAAITGQSSARLAERRAIATCEARAGQRTDWADPTVQGCTVIHRRAPAAIPGS